MIRRKTTKELLGESIHELARTKSVDRITVREITDNCGMSPATFYRYFHDKYELIAWIYNYQMEDIFLDFCEGAEGWSQTILDMIAILDSDRGFYENAMKNTAGPNSFFQSTRERSIELLTEAIRAHADGEVDEELLFDVKFYLRGISHSIADWYMNDLPCSAEALAQCLVRAMPERLKPYLK